MYPSVLVCLDLKFYTVTCFNTTQIADPNHPPKYMISVLFVIKHNNFYTLYLTIASKELTVNNVVRELDGFDSSKWKNLGLRVDVPYDQLSTIATNVAGKADAQKEALISTVDYWLRNDEYASWEKLATAVEKCDYAVLANKIRRSVGIVVSGKYLTCSAT